MGNLMKGTYQNNLRVNNLHELSGQTLLTDAPLDNQGLGNSFSPTDLLASALGSCMITIIAIRARSKNIEIGQPQYAAIKSMASGPRKIKKIELEIKFDVNLNQEERNFLEIEARKCPVALSLDHSIEQAVVFKYA